jgi:Lon protease-like protein
VQPGTFGVWQGIVTYLAQDPEIEVPSNLQSHADRLGKVIATAQQQGVIDKLPIFAPYHLDQCGWLANRYAEAIPISTELKLQLLSELDPLQRLESVIRLLQN